MATEDLVKKGHEDKELDVELLKEEHENNDEGVDQDEPQRGIDYIAQISYNSVSCQRQRLSFDLICRRGHKSYFLRCGNDKLTSWSFINQRR